MPPLADREDVARLISKYNLLAVPVVDDDNHVLGIVTVDDVIDAIVREQTEDVQKFGGMEALDEPYTEIAFRPHDQEARRLALRAVPRRDAHGDRDGALRGRDRTAVVLSLFIPLIISSGGNSGSQATSLIIRALALREIELGDWWRVALRELPAGLALGVILGVIGVIRIVLWQKLGWYDYGPHWLLVALTVGSALGGRGDVRLARRLDAAVPAQATRLRSSERIGAVRGDAGGRHRARHLLSASRSCILAWDVAVAAARELAVIPRLSARNECRFLPRRLRCSGQARRSE